jgi:glycosyltransferase involved in cell wall biosynthesis
MRILIVAPYLPWPPTSGGSAAQLATLQCLQADHQFTLVVPVYSPVQIEQARELQSRLPKIKVRAVFCGKPAEPPVKQFLRRAYRLARKFFWPKSSAAPGNEMFYPFSPLPRELLLAVNEELAAGQDICQVEFAELMPLATWLPDSITKIFILHQLHFTYVARYLAVHGRDAHAEYLAAWMRVQEIAYLQRYDAVIVFSENERRALAPYSEIRSVFTSPFPYLEEGRPPADAAFENKFIFVGAGGHDPNRDALRWLLAAVWPLIQKEIPDAKLMVIGKWDEALQKAFQVSGISFTGFVPDLGAAMRGGIMLVPLRIGGGIRTKILSAMAQGIPVVSTAIGAEGLLVTDGQDLLIRDGAGEFAGAAVQLARQPEPREKIRTTGLATVRRHYSPEQVRARRNEIYRLATAKK